MTPAQTRFVNILLQPESKAGFTGIVSATNYYLAVDDHEREEIRSLILELISRRRRLVLDLMMYVIIGAHDPQLLPALRLIAADEESSARDVAWHVLARESDSWPDTPPRERWNGPPLAMYERAVDLEDVLKQLASTR